MKYWLAALYLMLLGLDIFSKQWAASYLAPIHWQEGYPFNGMAVFDLGILSFSLNFVTNTGAAWGLFADRAGLLFIIRLAVILGLGFFLVFFNQKKIPALPMWLILTGAFGNALDYAFYGHVIDFFHFTFGGWSFPVFNFADSYITLGGVFLFFSMRAGKTAAAG